MTVVRRNKKWVAIVYVEGKQKWKTFSTKKEAEKYERDVLYRSERGEWADAGKLTLGEYLQSWYESYNGNWKQKTKDGYFYIIFSHVLQHPIAKTKMNSLRPMLFQKYSSDKLEEGLGKKTTANHLSMIRGALNCAIQDQLIYANPMASVKMPKWKQEKRKPIILKVDQMRLILDEARARRYMTLYIPVLLALAMGLRLGEVLGVQWHDILNDADIMSISRQLQRNSTGLRFETTKAAESDRKLPIPGGIMTELEKYKEAQAAIKNSLGEAYIDEDLINCELNGRRWEPRKWGQLFKDFVGEIGFKDLWFHDLRHNNITLLAGANVNQKKASVWAGHSDTQMIDQVYTHIQAEHLRDIANILNAIFFPNSLAEY